MRIQQWIGRLSHLIHFRGDEVLQDTVILKPEWLSKAISFVLEDKQTNEDKGLLGARVAFPSLRIPADQSTRTNASCRRKRTFPSLAR